MLLRLDGMNASETAKMSSGIQKLKKAVTSDEVRATLVTGKSKELPGKIQKAIGFESADD